MKQKQTSEGGTVRNHKPFSIKALILTGLLSAVAAAALLLGISYALIGTQGFSMLKAMAIINTKFVGEYDKTAMTNAALDAMVDQLGDRWSYFADQETYQNLQESRENAYVGIGVTVLWEDDCGLVIQSVLDGSPAKQAGILPGEQITAVNGVKLTADNRNDCISDIKGAEGTAVQLEIQSESGETRTLEVRRAEVKKDPVEFELLDGKVGYIKLKNFYTGSADEFIEAVDELQQQGATALVFDVRENPGGYVDELTKILDHLLPEGIIFRSQSKAGNETVYTSDANCVDLPMAILVNGDSYSAAEFFAAQLQETTGAVLAGEPTCGKGYSQQLFALPDGSAVNLSTARYFTSNGVSLAGVGLTPDPLVELSDEQHLQLELGELDHASDPQLQAALSALKNLN